MLQKSRFLTPGKRTSKNKKKGLVGTPFFLSSFLLCLCSIPSQLSWARALWTLNPVKALASPWISGSFWRGRRWGLETQMQIFKCKRESPESLVSQIFMDLGVGLLPLSLCYHLAAWRHLPNGERYPHFPIMPVCLAPWVVWDVRVARSCTGLCSWMQEQRDRRLLEELNWIVASSEATRCPHNAGQAWLLGIVSMRNALTDSW